MSPLGSGWVLKPPGTSTGVPSKVVHGFQSLVLEAEERLGAAQADHVHAQRLLQVGGDLAEHLVGLGHFDRRAGRIELQRLAELVHAADVHARHRRWRPGPGGRDPVVDGSGPLRRVGESS